MSRSQALEYLVRLGFAIAAIMHALPLIGVTGKHSLQKAYGVTLDSSDLVILLQHRAILFGLIAVSCLIAIWHSTWRLPVGIITVISAASFIVIALLQPHHAAITRIVWFDVVAVIALCCSLAAMKNLD